MNAILLDAAYAAAFAAGSPYFLYKMATTGKYREGLAARLGFVEPRGGGECIWVHGVSVGEVLAARSIVAGLEREFPGVDIAISTTTGTGHSIAKRTYAGKHVFYYPIDFSRAVARTFRRIRPRAVVLMEMEIWPNFVAHARATGVPVVVVNGRITERSYLRFKRLGGIARDFLSKVEAFFVQTDVYAERLTALGVAAQRVSVTGNVKFDTLSTEVDANRAARIRQELGVGRDEVLIIGGSTHRGEEEALLDAYARIHQAERRMRLLVVPRHDTRFDEAAGLIEARGYKVFRRSRVAKGHRPGGQRSESQRPEGERPGGAEVLLGDTMGELERLYEAADVAFVGGSLIPHGGQNVMEPAAKGKAVVFGPSMDNFPDAARILLAAGAARQIRDGSELAEALAAYAGTSAGSAAGRAGRDAVIRSKGATAKTVAKIAEILRKNPTVEGQVI